VVSVKDSTLIPAAHILWTDSTELLSLNNGQFVFQETLTTHITIMVQAPDFPTRNIIAKHK